VGPITDAADLVISDPVQAGTMAVMALPTPRRSISRASAGGGSNPALPMRIATWNVNSLKARLEKVEWWLDRAAPDVILLQETKLADSEAPTMPFRMRGYELVHHG